MLYILFPVLIHTIALVNFDYVFSILCHALYVGVEMKILKVFSWVTLYNYYIRYNWASQYRIDFVYVVGRVESRNYSQYVVDKIKMRMFFYG